MRYTKNVPTVDFEEYGYDIRLHANTREEAKEICALRIREYEQGLLPEIGEVQTKLHERKHRDSALHSFLYDRPVPVNDAAMLVRSVEMATLFGLALIAGLASFAGNVALFHLFGFGWLAAILLAPAATGLLLAVGHLAYEKIIARSKALQVLVILVVAALCIAALLQFGQARRMAVDRATSQPSTSSYVDESGSNTEAADDSEKTAHEPESQAHATLGGAMFTVLVAADLALGFLAGLLGRLRSDEDYAAWRELKKIRREVQALEKAIAELAVSLEIVKVRCTAGILRAEAVLHRRRPPYYKRLALVVLAASFLSLFGSHSVSAQTVERYEAILIDTSGSIARGGSGNELFREYLASTRKLLFTEPASSRIWVSTISTDSFGGPREIVKGWTPESHGVFNDDLTHARKQLATSFEKNSSEIKPVASGTDIIGALWRVKILMESGGKTKDGHAVEKTIWIFSDMMNETPSFPMPTSLPNGPRQMMEQLKAGGQIVPLPGYKVHVVGASPQGLSPQAWSAIKEFWERYFAAAGSMLVSYSQECDAAR